MMTPTPRPTTPSRTSRAPLVLAGGLVLALVAVGVVVVKGLGGATPNGVKAAAVGGAAGGSNPGKSDAVIASLDAINEYVRQHDWPKAEAIVTKLIEQHPADREIRLSAAQVYVGQKKFAEAYAQYQAALAVRAGGNGELESPVKSAKPTLADAPLHFEAATCASLAGQLDRAEEHYQLAQLGDPSQARFPLYLAMVQIKRGDDSAAMASLVRAVNLNPDLGEAWGTMAELETKENRLDLAMQHLEKARSLQPEMSRWRIAEARILNRKGEPQHAATILLTLDPSTRSDKSVLRLLGESYGLMRQPLEAARMYAAASDANPSDGELSYEAALWFERAEDKVQALRFAKLAAGLDQAGAAELVAHLEAGK